MAYVGLSDQKGFEVFVLFHLKLSEWSFYSPYIASLSSENRQLQQLCKCWDIQSEEVSVDIFRNSVKV